MCSLQHLPRPNDIRAAAALSPLLQLEMFHQLVFNVAPPHAMSPFPGARRLA
jgi:hypothetical protein